MLSVRWQQQTDAEVNALDALEGLDSRMTLAVWLPQDQDHYLSWAVDGSVHGTASDILRAIALAADVPSVLADHGSCSEFWELPQRMLSDPYGIAGLTLKAAALKVAKATG